MKKDLIQSFICILLIMSFPPFGIGQNAWQNNCEPATPSSGTTPHINKFVNFDSVFIIPTVFHILTQGGPENISRSHVLRTLEILNQDFNRQNPDTIDIAAPFHLVRGNPKVEFRLARIDPV